MAIDSNSSEITHEFPPYFRVYKDGHFERFKATIYVPPAVDSETGVEFRDILISPETGVKARIFIPKIDGPDQKFPLVVHYHGGAFCVGSPFDDNSRGFLTHLASVANAIVVSVDYRLAPEHKLPIAYDDSWSAFQWIVAHSSREGPDPWLNKYADFGRVFLAGESVGGNIAHQMAVRAGVAGVDEGVQVRALIIAHPFFADHEPDKLIQFLYPGSSGSDDDPNLNPKADPDLAKMVCPKVLVFVGETDWLKPRGVTYCATLKNSAWDGTLEMVENKGVGHCFHVFNPTWEEAVLLVQKWTSFMDQA